MLIVDVRVTRYVLKTYELVFEVKLLLTSHPALMREGESSIFSMCGETKSAYNILVAKPQENRPHGS